MLCYVKRIRRDRSHILSPTKTLSRSIEFLSIDWTLHSSALSGIGKQESLSHQQTNVIKLVTLEVVIKYSFSSNKMQSLNSANTELNINIIGHQWQIDVFNYCLLSSPLGHFLCVQQNLSNFVGFLPNCGLPLHRWKCYFLASKRTLSIF